MGSDDRDQTAWPGATPSDAEVAGTDAALRRAARRARREAAERGIEADDATTDRADPKPLSESLSEKSIQAALAAIEIYNKPRFAYREESFSILMANAWELMLKAKWALDHDDDQSSLHEVRNGTTKKNKSGNPITMGASSLCGKLLADPSSGLAQGCHNNILALLEIRNNAVHFLEEDPQLARRVLQIGTASLLNYTLLAEKWFGLDLSGHDMFLMPISFRHWFDTAESISVAHRSAEVKNLFGYMDALERDQAPDDVQRVAMYIETKLMKAKNEPAVRFAWTDDPDAPVLALREEDVLIKYPMNYQQLTCKMKDRYINFVLNRQYHALRKPLEGNDKYCFTRYLDPKRHRSGKKRFYSLNIFHEFDKHYRRRNASQPDEN